MSRHIALPIVLSGLIMIGTACSPGSPSSEPPTATLPVTATIELAPAPALSATSPSNAPSLAATVSDTSAPSPTLTTTPIATKRPTLVTTRRPSSSGPLTFNYEVVSIQPQPDGTATLTLRVFATGGSGRYTYYHDDIKQSGATFGIPGHCGKPFVHTIKVTSTDGQSISQQYFINGVCLTPTPTPK